MNGLTRAFHRKDAEKLEGATALKELKALRVDVSEGLGAIRVTLTAMLEELRKEKGKRP